ncbi:tryptophan 7-halogenase [Amycolatopsis alba]|uniref:Tryptophan halogenase n=1 Tax=Amycolatopsis alba DSM 44262 TaxID=1125972 RepID=A0A229S2E1_AMYAL|nr:tryptophan 7-halogenase [Amycolatopsis alba]OXM53093.1 tryptophan halogenase [Amycolatopsis alba DSM 44262]
METRTENVDVVVVGGGPGGSTAATLLARRGRSVVLLEKEQFPRYQIGESLLPSTVHGICRLLGVEKEMEAAGFMYKRGGSFRWGTNPVPWNFLFSISPEFSGPTSHAYQVERAKFDDILLKHAAASGVDVRERSEVIAAVRDEEAVRGVTYRDADGNEHEISARYVIDASGNRSSLWKATGGERQYSEHFKNVAVFGYFEGGGRLPGSNSGNILCEAFGEGWLWYIPLTDGLTSVGAVISREHVAQIQGDREAALMRFIGKSSYVKDMLTTATRVNDDSMYGEIRIRKDYSYANTKFHAPGIVLVGDAACFIDPVFSTGVHLATYAGVLAARSINSVFEGNVDESRAFAEFEGRYRREYSVFYEFLSSFYNMEQAEDSYFWQARKVTNLSESSFESFVSLVAGGFSHERVLTDPNEVAERFEQSTRQMAEAAERTGGMETDSGQRMNHLFGTPVVREVMEEMNAIQARGVAGEALVEPPLLPDGLVPTEDGLGWAEPAVVPA